MIKHFDRFGREFEWPPKRRRKANRKSKIKNPKSPTPGADDDDEEYVPPEHRELPPELVRLSEWRPREVEWLWTGMIPLRKVTLRPGRNDRGNSET